MPFTIQRSDTDKSPIILIDEAIDITSTSLSLVGKNTTDFGSPLATNTVHLLENFANDVAPVNPVPGQLWFDSGTKRLMLNRGGVSGETDGENDWHLLLISTDELQNEVNAIKTSLGSMVDSSSGVWTPDPTFADTNAWHYITKTSSSVVNALNQLDVGIENERLATIALTGTISTPLNAVINSLGGFIDSDGTFDASAPSGPGNLDQLTHIQSGPNGVPAMETLLEAFQNIDVSIDTVKSDLATILPVVPDAVAEINNIKNTLGFVDNVGEIDIPALNEMLHVNISPSGNLLSVLKNLDAGIETALIAAGDTGELPTIKTKLDNIEATSLGDMVTGSGLFDNTVLSATSFLGASTSVQNALEKLDTALAGATLAAPIVAVTVDQIIDGLGILGGSGVFDWAELNSLINVDGLTGAVGETFFTALQQLDDAITVAGTSGITASEVAGLHPLKSAFIFDTGVSGSYAAIPLATETLLIQWGSSSAPGEFGSQTFPQAFGNTQYSVVITQAVEGNAKRDARTSERTESGFVWFSTQKQIHWIAIGTA